uniref:Uncharacterized protein n=1 Tax=Noctiluca scintillans TaxID=2966 RepID=A0A7S1AZB3_NOCSC|mmetsp:Transcript_64522/g.170842  ORF Transcript_64522/g.170842 Transcript_64522/m.170842 type:complete len:602 (+) Transcript_64522:18-1823(+)
MKIRRGSWPLSVDERLSRVIHLQELSLQDFAAPAAPAAAAPTPAPLAPAAPRRRRSRIAAACFLVLLATQALGLRRIRVNEVPRRNATVEVLDRRMGELEGIEVEHATLQGRALELTTVQQQFEDLQRSKSAVLRHNEDLQRRVESLERRNAALQQRVEELSVVESEYQALKAGASQDAVLERERQELKQRTQQQSEQLEKYKRRVEVLEGAARKVQELEEGMRVEEAKHTTLMRQSKTQMEAQSQRVTKIENALKEMTNQRDALSEKNQELNTAYLNSQSQARKFAETIEAKQRTNSQHVEEIEKTRAGLSAEHQLEVERLKEELKALKASHAERIEELTKQHSQAAGDDLDRTRAEVHVPNIKFVAPQQRIGQPSVGDVNRLTSTPRHGGQMQHVGGLSVAALPIHTGVTPSRGTVTPMRGHHASPQPSPSSSFVTHRAPTPTRTGGAPGTHANQPLPVRMGLRPQVPHLGGSSNVPVGGGMSLQGSTNAPVGGSAGLPMATVVTDQTPAALAASVAAKRVLTNNMAQAYVANHHPSPTVREAVRSSPNSSVAQLRESFSRAQPVQPPILNSSALRSRPGTSRSTLQDTARTTYSNGSA